MSDGNNEGQGMKTDRAIANDIFEAFDSLRYSDFCDFVVKTLGEIRADERVKTMDEFGILHGEDARNLIEALERNTPPSPALKRLLRGSDD